ncbi:type 2 lantibiotic biosynthesis protein LanM [Ciceribacter lividus]|uniref:Type 2 lantibiotic biosynthesis protein LanM n=2 Tax=Ciceribacter TaxID=1648508 RepID=A0A6I7HIP7_9HYPH|nr:type 2 lanthipeptide synthetase LanM family protein [Ciceribacter lividus]RCW20648.1 type 2 lantibiotic biosynthesis protein LanM [Ciceribacter lividus]
MRLGVWDALSCLCNRPSVLTRRPLRGATHVTANAKELSLRERAIWMAECGSTSEVTGGVAHERMAWWARTFFRNRDLSFRQWLSFDGLTPEGVVGFVERDQRLSHARGTVAWADTRNDALAASAAVDLDGAATGNSLSIALRPYVLWALARLRNALAETAVFGAASSARVEARFTDHLLSRLQAVAMPSLGLAINMARLSGTLVGASPEERLSHFARQLGDPHERARVLAHFPVLDRMLAEVTTLITEAAVLLFAHLAQDECALAEPFGIVARALTDIEFGQGDPHCGARSVAILSFGDTKVVYKPKSLAIDVAFNRLIEWLGQRTEPAPAALTIVERGDHGWTEYIAARPCQTVAEVARYYQRLGSLLALLRLCGGVDVHFENLISSGDHPYVVDLETLLHRDARCPRGKASAVARRSAARNRTVLRVGLLPDWMTGADGVFDLSGAGADSDQVAPFLQPKFEQFDRDDPRIVYEKTKIAVRTNVPQLPDGPQPVTAFADDLLRGFRATYSALLSEREELLSGDGPMAAFGDVRTRWVARPTVQYALALRDSYHPTHMRDGIDHEMAFASLADGVEEAPHLRMLIASEKRDLWSGDIPYFWCQGSDRSLRDSSGYVVCADFFAETAAELLTAAVKRMGPADLARQEDIIRTAIKARSMVGGPRQPDALIGRLQHRADVEKLMDAAVTIGDHLVRRAIPVDGCVHWVGLAQRGERHYAAAILDDSLYDGTAGIAVFLAQLAQITGSRRHRLAAQQALHTARHAHYGSGRKARIGAFDGWAGSLYAELRFAACLGEWPDGRLRRLLSLIRRAAAFDTGLDIISGAAGAAIVALRLIGTELEDEAIATAQACALRLAETAVRTEHGASWETGPQRRRLSGFAHGAGGIAVALQAVGRVAGDDELRELAMQALSFERATFDPRRRLWRDLRESSERATAWCHGATGMLLSRIELSRHLNDPAIKDEVAAGVAAIHSHGGGGSHCLCHGTLGNTEPLLLLDAASRGVAQAIAAGALLESEFEGRWRCGVADFAETPGLMLGLAGIGYGLLRNALLGEVPSVLLLEV